MAGRNPVVNGILITLSVIGILLALWFITQVPQIIIILLLVIVLASGIAPMVDWLSSRKLPPGRWSLPKSVSIILIYLLVVVIIGTIGLFVGSVVIREAIQLGQNAPQYYNAARDAFIDLQRHYTFLPDIAEIVDRLRSQIGAISSYTYRALGSLFNFLGNFLVVITVFVITYYVLMEQQSIKQGFLKLIPPENRTKYSDVFAEMGDKIGGWLRAQLLLAFIVGASIVLVLWLIGVPYAFIIGIIGAMAELIPMLGPLVAGVPAVLLVIFQPVWQLIAVIIFFILLSMVEGNYLAPKFMKRQVGLSPFLSILVLLTGATLAGMIGALLAIPLTAAIQVFVRRIIIPSIERAESDE